MVQIINLFTSVSMCILRLSALSRSHLLIDFHLNWHRCKNPKCKNEFVWGQHRTTHAHILPSKTPILTQVVLKIHANINNPISALNVRESPKCPRIRGNQESRNTITSDFRLDVQIWLYHTCAMKNMQHNPCLVAESPNFYRAAWNAVAV